MLRCRTRVCGTTWRCSRTRRSSSWHSRRRYRYRARATTVHWRRHSRGMSDSRCPTVRSRCPWTPTTRSAFDPFPVPDATPGSCHCDLTEFCLPDRRGIDSDFTEYWYVTCNQTRLPSHLGTGRITTPDDRPTHSCCALLFNHVSYGTNAHAHLMHDLFGPPHSSSHWYLDRVSRFSTINARYQLIDRLTERTQNSTDKNRLVMLLQGNLV